MAVTGFGTGVAWLGAEGVVAGCGETVGVRRVAVEVGAVAGVGHAVAGAVGVVGVVGVAGAGDGAEGFVAIEMPDDVPVVLKVGATSVLLLGDAVWLTGDLGGVGPAV